MIVDIETDEILHEFDPEYGEEGCASIRMSWSPDGRYFVVPCFAQPRADVWDAQLGEHVMMLKHQVGVHASAWTTDGTRILTADAAGLIHFWDATSGELLYDMNAHTSIVWDIELSPDGSRVASGGDSGRVRVWDIETRQEVNSYHVGFSILDVYWSPDGTQLLTTGIRPIPDIRPVWQSTEALIEYAYTCCVFRELTPEERQLYGLSARNK
jgi:WD40 repeat protein